MRHNLQHCTLLRYLNIRIQHMCQKQQKYQKILKLLFCWNSAFHSVYIVTSMDVPFTVQTGFINTLYIYKHTHAMESHLMFLHSWFSFMYCKISKAPDPLSHCYISSIKIFPQFSVPHRYIKWEFHCIYFLRTLYVFYIFSSF